MKTHRVRRGEETWSGELRDGRDRQSSEVCVRLSPHAKMARYYDEFIDFIGRTILDAVGSPQSRGPLWRCVLA